MFLCVIRSVSVCVVKDEPRLVVLACEVVLQRVAE